MSLLHVKGIAEVQKISLYFCCILFSVASYAESDFWCSARGVDEVAYQERVIVSLPNTQIYEVNYANSDGYTMLGVAAEHLLSTAIYLDTYENTPLNEWLLGDEAREYINTYGKGEIVSDTAHIFPAVTDDSEKLLESLKRHERFYNESVEVYEKYQSRQDASPEMEREAIHKYYQLYSEIYENSLYSDLVERRKFRDLLKYSSNETVEGIFAEETEIAKGANPGWKDEDGNWRTDDGLPPGVGHLKSNYLFSLENLDPEVLLKGADFKTIIRHIQNENYDEDVDHISVDLDADADGLGLASEIASRSAQYRNTHKLIKEEYSQTLRVIGKLLSMGADPDLPMKSELCITSRDMLNAAYEVNGDSNLAAILSSLNKEVKNVSSELILMKAKEASDDDEEVFSGVKKRYGWVSMEALAESLPKPLRECGPVKDNLTMCQNSDSKIDVIRVPRSKGSSTKSTGLVHQMKTGVSQAVPILVEPEKEKHCASPFYHDSRFIRDEGNPFGLGVVNLTISDSSCDDKCISQISHAFIQAFADWKYSLSLTPRHLFAIKTPVGLYLDNRFVEYVKRYMKPEPRMSWYYGVVESEAAQLEASLEHSKLIGNAIFSQIGEERLEIDDESLEIDDESLEIDDESLEIDDESLEIVTAIKTPDRVFDKMVTDFAFKGFVRSYEVDEIFRSYPQLASMPNYECALRITHPEYQINDSDDFCNVAPKQLRVDVTFASPDRAREVAELDGRQVKLSNRKCFVDSSSGSLIKGLDVCVNHDSTYSINDVARHEVGHWLGVDHDKMNSNSIMSDVYEADTPDKKQNRCFDLKTQELASGVYYAISPYANRIPESVISSDHE